MPAGGPTYLRGTANDYDDDDEQRHHHLRFLDYKEPLSPNVPDNIEYKLHVTGLRKKRLWILLLGLATLAIITFFLLIVSFFTFHVYMYVFFPIYLITFNLFNC